MVSRHHITAADTIHYGAARFARGLAKYGRPGYPWNAPNYRNLGAALAIAAGALVNGATGAELPNNGTITYTTANAGVSPIDGAGLPAAANVQMADGKIYSVFPLDQPRNVSVQMTHGASLIATTLLVSGFDEYGIPIQELLSITATGTDKTATGKKAFKWILSYAFASAGNATTNTANVQWGDSFGLPFRVTDPNAVLMMANGQPDPDQTVTVADDTAPGNTTGDARGTVKSNVATDGNKKFAFMSFPTDASSVASLFGVAAGALPV